MTIFRPCIDIDEGQVTVREYLYAGTGAALVSGAPADRDLKTAAEYSELFKSHNLTGGHIYKHSHNCDDAALAAIKAWPGVWQVGGSMSLSNAQSWLDAGASKIILRNELYDMDAKFDEDLLRKFAEKVGTEAQDVGMIIQLKLPMPAARNGSARRRYFLPQKSTRNLLRRTQQMDLLYFPASDRRHDCQYFVLLLRAAIPPRERGWKTKRRGH